MLPAQIHVSKVCQCRGVSHNEAWIKTRGVLDEWVSVRVAVNILPALIAFGVRTGYVGVEYTTVSRPKMCQSCLDLVRQLVNSIHDKIVNKRVEGPL